MTDRELLELAAKAAGYEWHWYCAPIGKLFQIKVRDLCVFWNPLTDDGDALRLAVDLNLRVSSGVAEWEVSRELGIDSAIETQGDPYAATRRAIVRAAAEIGKAMP